MPEINIVSDCYLRMKAVSIVLKEGIERTGNFTEGRISFTKSVPISKKILSHHQFYKLTKSSSRPQPCNLWVAKCFSDYFFNRLSHFSDLPAVKQRV